ncbi:MAG TPA: sulfatase [Blastocatellia bacterium]|nr:sulfatase [Blastocatellia bacterium]
MISPAYKTAPEKLPVDQQCGENFQNRQKQPSLLSSLSSFAKLGAAAALMLGLVELVDTQYQLSPVFQSFAERLAFSAYFSLDIILGAVIGVVVGLAARAISYAYGFLLKLMKKGEPLSRLRKLIAALAVSVVAAAVLNQIPAVYRYVLGLMVEAQKLPYMYSHLFENRGIISYVIVLGLFGGCAALFLLTKNLSRMSKAFRASWLCLLVALVATTYYVDSRVEVELYGYSLHRSMFLLNTALATALAASLYLLSPRARALLAIDSRLKKSVAAVACGALLLLAAFTFYNFDKNLNLKAQVFTRTTQVKQHVMLAQWLLDFDRDGFSALLGGGDADDKSASINPNQIEIVGDGLDNNCIGGDLDQQTIESWSLRRAGLNVYTNQQAKPLNVIYFFIDALRADHLSAYGYGRHTSPNIDKLAARSALFENAFAPSANTFESAPKFMQSCYWDAHQQTWSEILAGRGYDTYLFPAHRLPMLQRYVKGVNVVEEARGQRLPKTIDLVIDTINNAPANRPFLAFIYIPDPHSPYKKHPEFNFGHAPVDLYDGEIAHTDYQMGRLFDWLEKTGRLDNTMIVIMSDHGEAFGERMVYRHSSQLYNEQTHVPMIVYIPGIAARRVSDFVSTIDLGPTILNSVGIDIPRSYLGVTLLPLMRGEPFTHPPIFAEESYRLSDFPNIRPEEEPQTVMSKYMIITQDGYKLIYNRSLYFFEMFNLKKDRGELINLYGIERKKAEELKQRLGRFVDIVMVSRPPDADESRFAPGQDVNREPWDEGEDQ